MEQGGGLRRFLLPTLGVFFLGILAVLLGFPGAQCPAPAVASIRVAEVEDAVGAPPKEAIGALTVPLQTRSNVSRQMRVFVATYKKQSLAKQLVAQLLSSDLVFLTFEITVISNWGHFTFPDAPPFSTWADSLSVIHNTIRSPRSWGHLAREWNAALMHGFGNLDKPQSDGVVLIHGDASLATNAWALDLYAEHGGAAGGGTLFLQTGRGDIFTSITAEGVRTIGLWDEHFVDVGGQESDYLLRAVHSAFDRVRIDDFGHDRYHRPWHRKVVGVDWVGDRHHFPTSGIPEYNFHKWSMEYWGELGRRKSVKAQACALAFFFVFSLLLARLFASHSPSPLSGNLRYPLGRAQVARCQGSALGRKHRVDQGH